MVVKTFLKSVLTIVVLFLLTAVSTTAHAKIIYVDDDGPADFSNIHAAINEADDGDVVIVAEGKYFGNISFNGKNITLRSTEPNDPNIVAATIIDGRQVTSVVILELYEYTNCVLDGFTITNGRAKYGGAVRCFNSSLALKNCVFVNNFAEDHGGAIFNYNSNTTLANCTFTQNSAHGTSGGGGAIQNVSSNVILTNCTFNKNQAYEAGAAMYNDGSSLILSNCVFSEHSTAHGGAMVNGYSDLTLTDCIFTTNSAIEWGGAMDNSVSFLTLTNCIFIGNSARWGGAIHNHEGTLNITNSTFCENRATSSGGAINNYYHTNLNLINCILSANYANQGPQIAIEKFSTLSVSHCNIQAGQTALYTSESVLQWGDGNIDTDPMFVRDPDPGLDGNWDGVDDDLGDLHLACNSPCLDAGTDTTEPPLPLTDLDGNPRIINAIVDMGPFEGPNQAFVIDGSPLVITEGTAADFTIALACDPGRSVTISLDYDAGDTDIIVKSDKPLIFNSKNFSVPRTVTLIAAEDQDQVEGTTRFNLRALGIPYSTVLASELENDVGPIVFVDDSATGQNDGSSWPNAFNQIYDAIAVAADAPHSVSQIYVAAGTYKPAEPGSDRNVTFHLINGLVIKGGYAGSAHVNSDARDIHTYETILSGDLNGDDAPVSDPEDLLTEPTRDDNSYNVITSIGTDATAVLDGVTITAGNAVGCYRGGGGMYIDSGSPKITHCTFSWNCAWNAGGMISMYGSPTLLNCTFISNSVSDSGGGMYNESGNPSLTNCMFVGNQSRYGGGMLTGGGSATITSCTFTQNSAKVKGGGIYGGSCHNLTLVNCIFSGNTADCGGAIHSNNASVLRLTNCTVAANSALSGNALACDSHWQIHPSNVQLTNCILWDKGDEIWNNDNSMITINHSDVWGSWAGQGNIDADPCFVDDVNEDYHLLHTSPCIDTGDPNYVAGPNEKDLDGNPRVTRGRIDMGAFEYQPRTIYVDDDAAGANDGSSWDNAYKYLQDALSTAYSGDEIRVAQGTYKPDLGAGITPGDREATFQLINGVTIIGGYAGEGSSDPNARDIELYETILSGDLEGNDVEIENFEWETLYDFTSHPSRDDNSYTVVTGNDTDSTAILDGFTITAGHANNPDADYGSPENNGGGMYNESGSPTLINCNFRINTIQSIWNSAGTNGGGMYNSNSSPTLRHCHFIENIVFSGDLSSHGGGMCNINSHPAMTKCVFRHNIVTGFDDEYYGGGMCNYNSNPTITDCLFIANDAYYSLGGGMHNRENSRPTLINCMFVENTARRGACILDEKSDTVLVNCVFSGNLAGYQGGAIFTGLNCNLMLTNCTFSGNLASYGRGIYADFGSNTTINNCIFWDGGDEIDGLVGSVIASYSNVQGGWTGQGNIDNDPCFVDPGYWDTNGVWVDGDYHLLQGSPCIDAGDPNYIAGPNETDLDGRPRVIGGRIDMGAYEAPIMAEAKVVPQTINLAGKGKSITCYIWLPYEYDVADIEPNSIFLENKIKPEQFLSNEDQQVAIAKFNREVVQAALEAGDIKLTITGRLTDGTIFEATDTIKVIDKATKK